METFVQARKAKIVLPVRWKAKAKIDALHVEDEGPGGQVARGSVVLTIAKLRVEAEEVRLTWLSEGDDLLLWAETVKLFRQQRAQPGQPYETKDIAMLTMANDQVSFFQ